MPAPGPARISPNPNRVLASSEAGLAVAEAQLGRIRKRPLSAWSGVRSRRCPPRPFIPTAAELCLTRLAAARENNPQLIASYFNEAAGRAAINVAKAAGRPTVSITGGLSRQREQLSQLQSIDAASITAQVTVPIYSGGANTSARRQAEHAKTRLAFETRDAELAIDQAVTQIWAQLKAARVTLSAAKRQVSGSGFGI